MSRFGLLLLLLLALLAALLLWWRHAPAPRPAATTPSPTAAAPAPAVTPVAGTPTPPAFRLAGVAVGTGGSYAVLEDPNGVTALYRLGDEISGLGRLTRIKEQEALVETTSGPLVLRVRPASTPTPAITMPDVAAPEAEPSSPPSPAADDSDLESSP